MRIGMILLLLILVSSFIGVGMWMVSTHLLKLENKNRALKKADLVAEDHERWVVDFLWCGGKPEEIPPRNGEAWNPDAPMPQLQPHDRWSISGKDRDTLHALMDACPRCSVMDVHNWTMCPDCANNPGIITIVRRGIRKSG